MGLNLRNHVEHQMVSQWLEKLFENEDVPSFRMTDQMLEILSAAMGKHQSAVENANEIIVMQKKLKEAFDKKGQEIQNVLTDQNLSLSPDTLEKVKEISVLGQKMNLKEPSATNFLLAVHAADDARCDALQHEKTTAYRMTSLSNKISQIMKDNEDRRRDIKAMEETADRQQSIGLKCSSQTLFFTRKFKEYEFLLAKYEKSLKSVGFEESLSHSALMDKAKKVESLKKSVDDLSAKLDSYMTLAPNEQLATLEVQRARLELEALVEEFNDLLSKSS